MKPLYLDVNKIYKVQVLVGDPVYCCLVRLITGEVMETSYSLQYETTLLKVEEVR